MEIQPVAAFIKPDQRNPWIKDQLGNDLLSTILHLQLPNFVSCGRDKPSHMTQNLVTVNCRQESDFYLILDPRIKLIWFDKSGASTKLKQDTTKQNSINTVHHKRYVLSNLWYKRQLNSK